MHESSGQSMDTAKNRQPSRNQHTRQAFPPDGAASLECAESRVHMLTEARLKELERYRRMVEMIPDAVVVCTGGVIVYANPAALTLFGVEGIHQLLQTPLHALIHPDDVHLLSESEASALHRTEVRIAGRDGRFRIAEVTALPIHCSDGPSVQYFMRDVTEQKRAEELLRKSDKLSVVGQLAAGVAHEIRNPLTSIRGFIQLMQTGKVEKKQYYDIILAEIDRIGLIINEFLVLAKPQAGRFHPRPLSVLLEQALAMINPHTARHGIEIHCSCAANLPPVVCEENQIKQLFINILKNAIEAMPEGGRIFIEIEPASREPGMAVVRIRDEGVGIPPERLPSLGEPFYTTKERGTGLGLFISYKIVEHHNGRLHIHSEERKGTTVEVYLPAGG